MVSAAPPESSSRRLSSVSAICFALAVIAFHAGFTLLLYRHLRQIRATGIPAEFLVFCLPTFLAYVGFFLLLRVWRVRLMPPWFSAFLLTILSFWLSLLLPFNIYGT